MQRNGQKYLRHHLKKSFRLWTAFRFLANAMLVIFDAAFNLVHNDR